MSLSPGNKSDDSFNFYLQKSIARWEPNLRGVKLLMPPFSHTFFNKSESFKLKFPDETK